MTHPSAAPRRLRLAAATILALGTATAAFVHFRAGAALDEGGGDYQIVGGRAYAVEPSRAQRSQTERMGGQTLVMTAELSDWVGSLWHGRRLAWTLFSLSAATALVCFYVAGLMAEAVEDGP